MMLPTSTPTKTANATSPTPNRHRLVSIDMDAGLSASVINDIKVKELHDIIDRMCASQDQNYKFLEPDSDTLSDYLVFRGSAVEWYLHLLHCYDLGWDIANIAMSFLDRIMVKHNNYCSSSRLETTKIMRLIAVCSLQLAVKLYAPNSTLKSQLLVALSNYEFGNNIFAAEKMLLQLLSWRVHPPTALSFIAHLIELMKIQTIPNVDFPANHILNLATQFSNLAVFSFTLSTTKPSLVAVASILNAIDQLTFSCDYEQRIISLLSFLAVDRTQVDDVRSQLWKLSQKKSQVMAGK